MRKDQVHDHPATHPAEGIKVLSALLLGREWEFRFLIYLANTTVWRNLSIATCFLGLGCSSVDV